MRAEPMVRYASGIDDKEARKEAIQAAALTLFLEDTRRLPSVAAIAARADLAKGTVYLYFDSKEQVFTSLLTREWRAFIAIVKEHFQGSTDAPAQTVAAFIAGYAGHIVAHPSLMRLDSMGYAILEPNLPDDKLLDFKMELAAAIEDAGAVVDVSLSLNPGVGVELLVGSFAMTRGLWQISDIPDSVRQSPEFARHPFSRLDFGRDLVRALIDYWRGAWGEFPAPSGPAPSGFPSSLDTTA